MRPFERRILKNHAPIWNILCAHLQYLLRPFEMPMRPNAMHRQISVFINFKTEQIKATGITSDEKSEGFYPTSDWTLSILPVLKIVEFGSLICICSLFICLFFVHVGCCKFLVFWRFLVTRLCPMILFWSPFLISYIKMCLPICIFI